MSHTMLYKTPGPHEIHGGKYDYIIVADDDVEQTLADGWFLTTPEAFHAFADANIKALNAELPSTNDNAAPTRAELLQKAGELGLKVDNRWGDQRIAAEIETALKA